MRSDEEVRKELRRVESDERLHYPTATVFENAPLALIQVELETARRILRWVLSENKEADRE